MLQSSLLHYFIETVTFSMCPTNTTKDQTGVAPGLYPVIPTDPQGHDKTFHRNTFH